MMASVAVPSSSAAKRMPHSAFPVIQPITPIIQPIIGGLLK
jgi:hypothetical protein